MVDCSLDLDGLKERRLPTFSTWPVLRMKGMIDRKTLPRADEEYSKVYGSNKD